MAAQAAEFEQLLELIPVSRSTIERLIKAGKFPPKHEISARRLVWYADEIVAWQDALPTNHRHRHKASQRSTCKPV